MDVAEGIVEEFQKMYPGAKVVFAGDSSDPDAVKVQEEVNQALMMMLASGQCMDCGKVMPDWPGKDMSDDWQPAKGWKHFNDLSGEICGWQCPECDAKE